MECFAPLDPTRTYRITVWPGDAVYLSLTVYGGPNDGRYSERIVGTANSRDTAPGLDGSIRIVVSPELPSEAGVAWIKLEPDAVAAITRDYLNHPTTGRRATWSKNGSSGWPSASPTSRTSASGLALRGQTQLQSARLDRGGLTWLTPRKPQKPLTGGFHPQSVDLDFLWWRLWDYVRTPVKVTFCSTRTLR